MAEPETGRLGRRPRIAITLGDTGGVGPEIAVKAAFSPEVREACEALLVSSAPVARGRPDCRRGDREVRSVGHPREFDPEFPDLQVLETDTLGPGEREVGKVSVANGRAAAEDTRRAAELALSGDVGAVVWSSSISSRWRGGPPRRQKTRRDKMRTRRASRQTKPQQAASGPR